ncbi:alpha-tocopherol transfer protein-like isoform X1 [Haematobia irritans]|uniref:alpha-tocopherol transfer protein-like isoform X1 n=1 Tax=Haematobia irritans TaxID=7368 RepID=UPI003F50A322
MSHIISLPEDLQKVAIEELNEDPQRIDEDLEILKLWLKKQNHLRARTDDQFLIQFLRGCKYSLEKCKQKLDSFYTMKTKYPELFAITDLDNKEFRDYHHTGSTLVLPRPLNDNGPRIIWIKHNYDPFEFTVSNIIQHITALGEIYMLRDPYACIQGLGIVFDLSKFTFNHLKPITPLDIKKGIKFFENTLPLRAKFYCFINISPAGEQMHKLFMHLLPENIKKRVFIIGTNMDKLFEHIPKRYLPKEYGGENGTADDIIMEQNKLFDQYREYFQENIKYGTDEHLRINKSKMDFGDNLGIGGSFRKLLVD